MTPQHFKKQMDRLVDTFGPASFRKERVELLWREAAEFRDDWFTRVVDKFIAELRQAPMITEFRTEMSLEREKGWAKKKQEHAKDAEEFYMLADDVDMRGSMIRTIIDRMDKNVPDDVWAKFVDGIKRLTHSPVCRGCGGSGLHLDDQNCVSRCACMAGKRDHRPYPRLVAVT